MFTTVDGQQIDKKDISPNLPLPSLTLGAPAGGNRREVRVVLADDDRHFVEAMSSLFLARDPEIALGLKCEMKGEQARFTLSGRSSLNAAHLFLEGECLGNITAENGTVSLDTRCLPAGTYTVRAVGENTEGTLLPSVSAVLKVAPRYTLSCPAVEEEFHIPYDKSDMTLPLKVTRATNVGIAKTRVYMAGEFMVESDQPTFDVPMKLTNAPTGKSTIEVVGYDKDGFAYPTETLRVKIKNEVWESNVGSEPDYQRILANLREIAVLSESAKMWFDRAAAEPTFYETNHITHGQVRDTNGAWINITYLNTLLTPGHGKEYMNNARQEVNAMAKLSLENGRLYKILQLKELARNAYKQVVQYAGIESSLGKRACEALADM